jgi:pSer/pThr/pTyr-binding forkhead associated (FHA) protein
MMVELGDEQLTLGRLDNAKGSTVDIDLTQYGALKTGVSRVHAVFFRGDDDTLYVADLGSANGTFLNGHPLTVNEPSPVSNGDEISLGKMRMHVYFGSPAFTATSS